MPEIGKKVPSLKGTPATTRQLKLSDLKGQWVVVYFYPKDSTPGCTTEAQGLSRPLPALPQAQRRRSSACRATR